MAEGTISRRAILTTFGLAATTKSVTSAPLVDLALVLAIDCSFSVSEASYHLQMRGFGEAFLDPEVQGAIWKGYHKRIAVAAFHWSDPDRQQLILPWQIVENARSARGIAQAFFRAPRDNRIGFTATGEAILYGINLLGHAPPAVRQVIDVSTDGSPNSGQSAPPARDAAVKAGITVNALGILEEEPFLAPVLERDVIGGDGAFLVIASNFSDFGRAIKRKLIREISNSVAT
ncbi:MAG: DUF1194 domain-containing protein [Aestuariivirga sp.]